MPVAKQKKTKPDQHASNRMIRLPETYHALLMEAARKNARPATWELRVALLKHFKEMGLEIPTEMEI